jgi:hypothetical protein
MPSLELGEQLPVDLRKFYELCGGVILHHESAFCLRISPPNKFVRANPEIMIGLTDEQLNQTKDHMSWKWYVVAQGSGSQFVTIDLDERRCGRCYDSFWTSHPYSSVIIANSFGEFLVKAFMSGRKQYYWDGMSPRVSATTQLT